MMIFRRDSSKANCMVSDCGKFRVIKIQYGIDWIYSAEYLRETPTKSGYLAQSWAIVHRPVKTFEAAKQQIEQHKALMGVRNAV